MEGLIPMVYNAVKKKKKMKYYSNLSSGSKLYTDTEPDACASTTDRFFMSPQPEDYKSRSASAQYQDRFFYTPQREHLGYIHEPWHKEARSQELATASAKTYRERKSMDEMKIHAQQRGAVCEYLISFSSC
jgi:hypothetical protein